MRTKAVLNFSVHPEYGSVTVPFPIPRDEYDHTLELLDRLGIGDALLQDCHVVELESPCPVLKRLEGTEVNVDELDYLAKRLDSFCTREDDQFLAMAHKLDISDIRDFINLTACCQQVTVITDFSDLEQVGRDHCMNLNGGSMPMEKYQALDGRKEALHLIQSGQGTVTPYGVVYENGMKLEQLCLADFCREENIPCPETPLRYMLRPASPDEAGLFYALPPEREKQTGLTEKGRQTLKNQGMTMGGMTL